MTVMIPTFFGVHPALIRSGFLRKMTLSQCRLYLYLMEASEYRRTLQIKAKDSEIETAVGAAPRSLCNARKKLQEYGLIQYGGGAGSAYVYTICDPETGRPYPGDPNKRKEYVKKANRQAPPAAPSLATSQAVRLKPNLPPRAYGLPGVFDD